jgi:hypothetical protein
LLDNPAEWYGFDFDKIIEFRANLVRSKKKEYIKPRSKFVESLQELVLSAKPLWIETKFKKVPKYVLSFSPISQPMGPTGILEKFRITENPKIPRKVEKIVFDDLKAEEQVFELYTRGYDVYYITKIFSAGVLGKDKKLVPTRWSITAVDDIIARKLAERIKTYPKISEYLVWHNTYLDNHFEILFIPGVWSFEQFEAWAPGTLWTSQESKYTITVEREGYRGRRDYAIKEGGGYYAARLAICEQLERMKRQASVVVFREIYEGYIMPVGVWEVRENVRHAFQKPPRKFATLQEALRDIEKRLRIPIREYLQRSCILQQKSLNEFFKI